MLFITHHQDVEGKMGPKNELTVKCTLHTSHVHLYYPFTRGDIIKSLAWGGGTWGSREGKDVIVHSNCNTIQLNPSIPRSHKDHALPAHPVGIPSKKGSRPTGKIKTVLCPSAVYRVHLYHHGNNSH